MKRFLCISLILVLAVTLLTACWPKENPPTVHVVHNGQLYEVPDETTGVAELDDSKMIDATIIPYNVMPAKEGEVNVNAQTVQICDLDENEFLVIIDGEQHLIER